MEPNGGFTLQPGETKALRIKLKGSIPANQSADADGLFTETVGVRAICPGADGKPKRAETAIRYSIRATVRFDPAVVRVGVVSHRDPLFEQTTLSNSPLPLLDYAGNAAAAALDPTNTPQAVQIAANGVPVPNTFEYTIDDAPAMLFPNGFTAISADLTRDRFDYIDHQMVFREYVVVRYADGTLYPVLSVEWSVTFYVHTNVANFGPNTLSPLSIMGWDAAGFERDNSDPLVTEPPIANDSFGFREIT